VDAKRKNLALPEMPLTYSSSISPADFAYYFDGVELRRALAAGFSGTIKGCKL
jgi:hypothetical protein